MNRLTFLVRTAILTLALGCSSSGSAHPGHVDTNDEGGAGGATAGAGGDSTGGGGGHAGTGGLGGNGGGGDSTGGAGGDLPIDAAPPSVDSEDDVAPPEDTSRPRLDAARDSALDMMAADRPRPTDAPPGAYNPCPAKGKPCVVLPLGDSLTQGAYSSGGGYRRELFREIVAHNQSVTFVGSQSAGPAMLDGVAVPFPRHHEGHGGFTIEGISTWLTDNNTIATFKPDIVLLHIGTNNGIRHPGPNIPNVLSLLGKLIDQLTTADPRMLIVVAQIIPSKSDDGVKNTLAYNAGIPAVVAARANAGKHVIVVDLHTPFVADPNWKVDYLPTSDVHPIDAGYDVMGKAWYSVLGSLLR